MAQCMTWIRSQAVVLSALAAVTANSRPANAETAKDIIGAWTPVKIEMMVGGKDVEPFGAQPIGTVFFSENGHYNIVIMKRDLPKFAANNQVLGTPEENAAIIHGITASFGTFSVKEKTIELHVEGATFPNWDDTQLNWTITSLSPDRLDYYLVSPQGIKATTSLQRLK